MVITKDVSTLDVASCKAHPSAVELPASATVLVTTMLYGLNWELPTTAVSFPDPVATCSPSTFTWKAV